LLALSLTLAALALAALALAARSALARSRAWALLRVSRTLLVLLRVALPCGVRVGGALLAVAVAVSATVPIAAVTVTTVAISVTAAAGGIAVAIAAIAVTTVPIAAISIATVTAMVATTAAMLGSLALAIAVVAPRWALSVAAFVGFRRCGHRAAAAEQKRPEAREDSGLRHGYGHGHLRCFLGRWWGGGRRCRCAR
jgi:hypothetical protein